MPRRRIKTIVKGIIKSYVSKNRDKTNRQLAVELQRVIFEDYGEISPAESTLVDTLIPEARKSIDPIDSPWGILDIAQYPIPPEILSIVVTAWGRELLKGDPLTIREALWIARLYYIERDFSLKQYGGRPVAEVLEELGKLDTEAEKLVQEGILEKIPEEEQPRDDIDVLTIYAKTYAIHEIVFRIMQGHPSKPEDMWEEWDSDIHYYQGITGEMKLPHKVRVEVRKRGVYIPHDTIRKAQKRTYRGAYNEGTHTSKG